MGDIDQIALGTIKVSISVPYISLLDLSIEEERNEHGKLYLRLMVKENTEDNTVVSLQGQEVQVKVPDGACIFSGIVTGAKLIMEDQYKELTVTAYSYSCLADIKRNSRTFQDSSKTVSFVVKSVLAAYGAKVTVKDDATIPHIVYQANETDWTFAVRIANQYGIPLFTDARQQGVLVSLGALGFENKSLDSSAYTKAEVKNLTELRAMQANCDSTVSAFEFAGNQMLSYDLSIATGDLVNGKFVTGNNISADKELMVNSIFLYENSVVKSDFRHMTDSTLVSNVITGTVLEVDGNEIKVKFDVDAESLGSEMKLTYECAINNSFYSMPDVGDKVFVYYENNGKAVCLGSKHVNTGHPDFMKPDEKVLTNYDHMIRLVPNEMHVTATREDHDNYSYDEITISMSGSEGITIHSGRDIYLNSDTTLSLSAMEEPETGTDYLNGFKQFTTLAQQGLDKYNGDKGTSKEDQAAKIDPAAQLKDKIVKNAINTVKSTLYLDIIEKMRSQKGVSLQSTAVAPEVFDTGMLTMTGYDVLSFTVGTSQIIFDEAYKNISILADEFEWLGYKQGTHEQSSKENKDGWDTLLDGIQLALDFAGFIPGIGAIFDVANAAISLARGDVVGAGLSLVSAIPGIGDAVGAAKGLAKGAKIVKTVKTLTKAQRVMAVIKAIKAGADFLATAYRNHESVIKFFKLLFTGQIDITNPKDWDLFLATMQTAKSGADVTKSIKTAATGSETNYSTDNSDDGGTNPGHNSDNDSDTSNPGHNSDNDSDTSNPGHNSDNDSGGRPAGHNSNDDADGSSSAHPQNNEDAGGNPNPHPGNEDSAEAGRANSDNTSDTDTQTPRNQDNQADTTQNPTNEGDPVNIATGSFTNENIDFTIQDITGEFKLVRKYQSIYENRDRMIGKRWYLNVESSMYWKDDIMTIQLPDSHQEKFKKSRLGWENVRRGEESFVLLESKERYLLKDRKKKCTYQFNRGGRLTAIMDKNENETKFYYEYNKLVKIAFTSGQYLKFSYYNGKVTEITDVLGRKVIYKYKGIELDTVTYANDGVIRYEYTKEGYIKSITDQLNNNYVTNYYDKKGRINRQIISDGEEYIYLYDDRTRCNTFITGSTKNEVQVEYDSNNRVTKRIYMDGTYEEFEFDPCENEIYHRDRLGNITLKTFDTQSHLLEEVFSNGLKINYKYDEMGNVIAKTDNAKREEYFGYDKLGNMISRKIRLTENTWAEEGFSYDASGRLLSITDANGNTSRYEYKTGFSKPSVYITAEGDSFYYEYDKAGRLMSVEDEFGKVTYGYNTMDYRMFIKDAEGNITKFQYDRLNNRTKTIYPNQYNELTGEGDGILYEYNEKDQLYRITDAMGNVISMPPNCEGKILKEINPNTYDLTTEDGEGITYEYDTFSRRTKIQYPDGGTERIFYDANSNIVKKIKPMEYEEKTDNGDGYAYEYDAMNRLTLIRNPYGVVEKCYEYDLHGYISKEIGTKGYQISDQQEKRIGTLYRYNFYGWLVERREPMKVEGDTVWYQLTQYEYDKTGKVTCEKRYLDYQKETGAIGRQLQINYRYDKNRHLIEVTDSVGACVQYKYNSNNKLVYTRKKINEETAQITNYVYSPAGRQIKQMELCDKEETGKSFAVTEFEYDKSGNITKITTPKGHTIRREYDASNRLIRECFKGADGQINRTMAYTYDKAGNVIANTDTNGNQVLISYDLLNRMTKMVGKNGGISLTEYDANGRVVRKVSPNEYAKAGTEALGWQYAYTLTDKLLRITSPAGIVEQERTYNDAGELTSQMDAMEHGASFIYDFAGRRLKVETSNSSSEVYEYDAMGNVISVVNGNGNKTIYHTDAWGKVTGIQTADEVLEQYFYDYAGNMVHSIDGEGHESFYGYNMLNKLASTTDAAGNQEWYRYDLEGDLSSYTDRNGNTTKFTFNMLHQMVSKKAADSSITQTFGYDRDGLLAYAITDGMRYDYSYYEDGRLKEKRASGRTLLHYEYDLNGNKTKQSDITGKLTEYRYDLLDRMSEIYDNKNKVAAYSYYLDGMVKSVTAGENLVTEYAYDADRNMTGLKASLAGESIVDNAYCFDHNGNITRKQSLGGVTEYTYDERSQLVKAAYPSYTEELFYDRAGNRTKRIANDQVQRYEYDERNCLISQTICSTVTENMLKNIQYDYDAQGNLLQDGDASYTYDTFNRTTKVETTTGQVQVNRYDAEGLRHEVEENGKLVQFLYSGRDVVVETKDEKRNRYVRNARRLIVSDAESARTYYHYASDELGSITDIISDKNERAAHYEYDAFGNTVVCEEKIENRFRFCGQQFDSVTGQYYLRARYYNPVIGRFTQEDTYRGDGLNLYAYCKNNPVNYWDPSGNCGQDANDNSNGQTPITDPSRLLPGPTAEDAPPRLPAPETYPALPGPTVDDAPLGLPAPETYPALPGPTASDAPLALPGPTASSRPLGLPGPTASSAPLALPAPSGTNPWMDGTEITSMPAPLNCYVDMALAPGQTNPGGWGTYDHIPDVSYVRNELAVTPEFKQEVATVQRYHIPEGTQIQVGTVGPQDYNGTTYNGGGNQVQILNYEDRSTLIPVGAPRPIS